ncbi:MAG: tetratricopeptide repeat protein [Elusimicrobia bacterium]|nr:tetratricopeptide repeat protein [Elusimicrobiota bacterium]
MLKFLKSNLFFFLLLTTIVFLLYGKSINFDFTNHDDASLIVNNINYLSQWKNIPSLFTTSAYLSKNYYYYRPILTLSFSIEAILFYNNTKIYHITNIILFILALYLMYVFLSKLNTNKTVLKLLMILICVHPILSSSVVWVPARNDTLLAVFVFLSFIFFIKYLENNSLTNLALYISFFTISLLTKESAIFVMFLYILFIYCFDYKLSKKETLKNLFIFFCVFAVYFCLRSVSVRAVKMGEHIIYFKDYFDNVIYGYAYFIYKIFNFFDIPIMVDTLNINKVLHLISYIFSFLILYVMYRKKMISFKVLFFCLVWFIVWLLPTFLFLKSNYLLLFHRILIPLFAVILVSCKLLEKIYFKYKKLFVTVYILLFGILCFNSSLQANKYSTSESYIKYSEKYAGNSPIVQSVILQDYMYKKDYDKAMEIAKKIVEEYPEFIAGKTRMAQILYKQGKIKEAEELYIELLPTQKEETQYVCCRELSKIYYEQNELDKALFYGQQAHKLRPYNTNAQENMAIIYAKAGYYKEAINILSNLLSFDKKNVQYMYNLGRLYEASGNIDIAIEYAKLAVLEEPYNDEYKQYLKLLENKKNEG